MHQGDGGSGGPHRRRVVVTGIGAVTPIGVGVEGLWQGVRAERSAVRRISRFDASALPARIAAQVEGFDPSDFVDGRALRRLDRCSQFALASSVMAVQDAGLDLAREDRSRMGVCIGSALGGAAYAEEQHERYLRAGVRCVEPHLALQMFVGAGSCSTAILLGLTGYCSSNADSCASGAIAIANGLRAIQRGDVDAILAGGSEAPLAPLCYGAFALIRALSTRNEDPERACRPFDRDRDGFVMAEGAAVLLLEEREKAIARGARVYAEILGAGITNDGHHMTAPRPDGSSAARAISLALSDAEMMPENVDYVNAHGSSTPLNDSTETLALKTALGDVARRVPICGTKAMHGHALGATGAIEAAICCLAIDRGYIPPTINLDSPDPACDLDYVPHRGRCAGIRVALSNSFGFGGINAALIFQKTPGAWASGVSRQECEAATVNRSLSSFASGGLRAHPPNLAGVPTGSHRRRAPFLSKRSKPKPGRKPAAARRHGPVRREGRFRVAAGVWAAMRVESGRRRPGSDSPKR